MANSEIHESGDQSVHRYWLHATTLVIVGAAVAVSCGGGETQTASPTGDDSGAALYAENCASCHGADLRGTDDGPSHLSIVYEPDHHGDDSFRAAILDGTRQHHWTFGDMEPITGLSGAEIDEIIAYVRSEQERLGFER